MKRCPQCDFVYEDDQSFCDMDGSELFHAAQTLPLPPLESVAPEMASIAAEPANVAPEPVSVATKPASPPAKSKRKSKGKGSAVTAIAAVALLAFLFTVYYAVTHRSRPGSSTRSVARATAPPQPTSQLEPSPALAEVPLPEPSSSPDLTPPLPTAKPSTPVRLPSSPVSAGGTSRGPVVIRLKNGAAVKADEAWEKREGIWYRQGSVVTLIKRDRVGTIERPAPARSAAAKPEVKKPNAASDPKKESRISSLLKSTGRILKKPFRL